MKYVFNILAVTFIGWPSAVAGYLWSAASSGWSTGCFLYQRHEDAAVRKFTEIPPGSCRLEAAEEWRLLLLYG